MNTNGNPYANKTFLTNRLNALTAALNNNRADLKKMLFSPYFNPVDYRSLELHIHGQEREVALIQNCLNKINN